jgi:hypothetical protein
MMTYMDEVDATLAEERLLPAIRRAMHALPLLDRQLIALHFAGGLSAHEIASALALPRTFILQRLRAANCGLRDRLSRDGIPETVSNDCVGRALTSGFSAPSGLYGKIQQRLSAALQVRGSLRREIGLAGRFAILLAVYASSFGNSEEPRSCKAPISTTTALSRATSDWSLSRSRNA